MQSFQLAKSEGLARRLRSENTARAAGAAFEAVEQPLGGEKAEAALIAGDDAGGTIVDFDDVGVGLGLGHDCSLAEVSAFRS